MSCSFRWEQASDENELPYLPQMQAVQALAGNTYPGCNAEPALIGISISVLVFLLSLPFASSATAAGAWRRHTIDNTSRGADGVRLADVNSDGLADIATGWEEGGVIRVYLHPGVDGVRSQWPRVTVGRVRAPEDAVFADLDRDGAVDVISCCEGRNRTVFVHWAPSAAAAYLDPSAWQTNRIDCTQQQQMWMFALPLQVDGTHGMDLIVGSKGSQASVGWLEAPADPRQMRAWQFHSIYQAGWIMSLQAHDMDLDGDLDVLLSDRKGPTRGLLWLENQGPEMSKAQWPVRRLAGEDREVMFLTLTDQLQPGKRHVLAAVRGRGILLLEQLAAHTEWRASEIPMPDNCGTGKGVAVGDIDLDGRSDVVFSCEAAREAKSGVGWLSPPDKANDNWQSHEISGPSGVKFDRIELLDLDGDGDLDLLTCEERDNLGLIWYENPAR